MRRFILLAYLGMVLLVLGTLDALSVVLVLAPVVFLMYALIIKKTDLGIVGFALFMFLGVPTIKLENFENAADMLIVIVLVIVPSILLLKTIMDLENKKVREKIKAVPLGAVILISASIAVILFALTRITLFDIYLQGAEATSAQILLLAAMTIITCTPFLERTKI